MKPRHILNCLCCMALLAWPHAIFADTRPDAHAPISIMAEHTHKQGEFMFSYRYMHMRMNDMRNGTDTLAVNEVLGGGTNTGDYMVTPVEMTMDMHMLGLMHARSERLTWMFMLPYLELSMEHLISPMHSMHPDEMFTTESSGIGDFKTTAIFALEKTPQYSTLLSLGLSLPTGSIDEEDALLSMPALGKTQLPFPMQTGSGTLDILPAITFNRVLEQRSWGTQLSATIRTGRNRNGYSLGNLYQLQSWHAWVLNKELSLSMRLAFEHRGNVDGDDEKRQLPLSMDMGSMTVGTVPTADPARQGGQRLDGAVGLNGIYGEAEHRLALEIGAPLQQRLDGPQMERGLMMILGYQKAF